MIVLGYLQMVENENFGVSLHLFRKNKKQVKPDSIFFFRLM